MIALRIINVLIWGSMIFYMLPGALAAFSNRSRRGDAMRLACLLTALIMVGFNVRWLWFRDNMTLWQMLLVLSAGLGFYILWLAHAYGRGPRV